MKRLIPAAIVAVGIHSLLMGMDFSWMALTVPQMPSTGSVTIVLESIQPQRIKLPNQPLSTKRYPREVKSDVVETAPPNLLPKTPPVLSKPVETKRKPEKKPPVVKSTPARKVRPVQPKQLEPPTHHGWHACICDRDHVGVSRRVRKRQEIDLRDLKVPPDISRRSVVDPA